MALGELSDDFDLFISVLPQLEHSKGQQSLPEYLFLELLTKSLGIDAENCVTMSQSNIPVVAISIPAQALIPVETFGVFLSSSTVQGVPIVMQPSDKEQRVT
eukprot:6462188-Amphidinium_carterae.3